MAHGAYSKRRVSATRRSNSKPLGIAKKPKPKPKPSVSLKNQIRSLERMLRKNLPPEVRDAQEQKLEALKKQQEIHTRLAAERKIFLRDRKIKFFERRKIERRIRRLEKLHRASSSSSSAAQPYPDQLSALKKDLQYVMYFPKNEKYVPLFTGGDDSEIVDRRNGLRKQIEDRLVAAAASGKDLEETGSEDDGLLDLSDDDFFLAGSSSDEADADDEWTDKSAREQASSASGKGVSGMSSDEKNQRQISARALMPPPRPSNMKLSRFGSSSGHNSSAQRSEISTSSNTSNSKSSSDFKVRPSRSGTGHGSSLSSNSDAHKPRRKRRPKKKKKQFGQYLFSAPLSVIVFERVTKNAVCGLWAWRSKLNLVGGHINVFTGEWTQKDAGIGTSIDSFYEYLLKAYLLFGDEEYLYIFQEAYAAAMHYLYHDPCLQAFWPGLQVLAGDINPAIRTHAAFLSVWRRYGFTPESFNLASLSVQMSSVANFTLYLSSPGSWAKELPFAARANRELLLAIRSYQRS
ncbi:Alpha-mannosidase I MNS4 [Glycine soja]